MIENPFVVESPEKLNPNQIAELFVSEFTDLESIRQRKHTFLWGSRGSGKSMLFRFLEPECQYIVNNGCDEYFCTPKPFLGIYFPIKEGMLNKEEFRFIDKFHSIVISEHLMNVLIAERTINCIKEQIPIKYINSDKCRIFVNKVVSFFDRISINNSLSEIMEEKKYEMGTLESLQELFFAESRKVIEFLRRCAFKGNNAEYSGATSGYHDFLLPFMKEVQILLGNPELSVYLLIDDAGRVLPEQQKIINSWIANRDQNVICIKASAVREDYRTFKTKDEWLIDEVHDFTEIDIESIYTNDQTNYKKKVALIAERRLKISDLPTKSIDEFLPSDIEQDKRLEEIKIIMGDEWERNPVGRKEDYIYRYSIARLFQELGQKKQRRNYAGYNNLVNISSGVVRDFLEPCYLMFDRYVSKGNQDISKIQNIPQFIQNQVIFEYSEGMIIKFDQIINELGETEYDVGRMLRTLVESLGKLFYEKLHDPNAREARLFSFTIKNESELTIDIRKALELGLKYRYFQKRTYSSKEGGGREPWYILNRRLCPVYKLDPSGFEGRISLTSQVLNIACTDTNKFIKLRLKLDTGSSTQMSLFDEESGGDFNFEK